MYIYFGLSTKDYSKFFEESIIEVVLKIASKKTCSVRNTP